MQGNGLHIGELLKETARLLVMSALPVLSAHLVAWLGKKAPSPTSPSAEPEVAKDGDS